MAGVCLSVTSHLNTMAHGDTWGRVKAQFGPGCMALINRRFLPSATLPLKTPSRTNHHKKPWRLSITTLDYLQFFLMETMGLSSPVICGDHGLEQRTTLPHTWLTLFKETFLLHKTPKLLRSFTQLYWPKSRCFDYLYQDAEMLLRNYPVQATICLYADSSSDEDSNDEEEEMEKELN
ncbi:hypothetical protein F7725_019685 [Dissostichus mawsoni]|uniref:Uncharacterized protein n=1 Tax=Dissostichus mawsoni TaxID=36200 RepID=A0A7J5YKF3_DISMA|nr:hypothetical protein F7725_019685 [Dissostichus mawsoni]